ncbi:adenine phosphoribosyltransferase [Chloroflexota bacterium]
MYDSKHDSDSVSGNNDELLEYIRDIVDFPKKGIIFKDITPLLLDKRAFRIMVDKISYKFQDSNIDIVAAIDARGFLIGSAVAYALDAGIVPIRKKGKLPYETLEVEYDLEYGTDTLEVHTDAIRSGQTVLLVDDLLATGGTAQAAINMIKKCNGNLLCSVFVIELTELKGREKLEGTSVYSMLQY